MTFGEGAAYIVLERASDAAKRAVSAHAILAGAAVQADAFDPILFDPSGDGQARTMKARAARRQLPSRIHRLD